MAKNAKSGKKGPKMNSRLATADRRPVGENYGHVPARAVVCLMAVFILGGIFITRGTTEEDSLPSGMCAGGGQCSCPGAPPGSEEGLVVLIARQWDPSPQAAAQHQDVSYVQPRMGEKEVVLPHSSLSSCDVVALVELAMQALPLTEGAYRGKGLPSLHTEAGLPLSAEALQQLQPRQRLVLLERGELFLYNPSSTPHLIDLGDGQMANVTTISSVPRVFLIRNFLRDGEPEHVIKRAKPQMERAGVHFYETEQDRSAAKQVRTSSNTFPNAAGDPVLTGIDERVARLLRLRHHRLSVSSPQYINQVEAQMEHMQVVNYQPSQNYEAHRDYFPRELYPSWGELQEDKNRMATVFFYLNDLKEDQGGETFFPRAGGGPLPRNFADCSLGMKVQPKLGDAILFYSMHAQGVMRGAVDDFSWHGGCTVNYGEKWGANKWIWNYPSGSTRL